MRTGVVVGVDGSASANAAVLWAAEEAARHREPLALVHAYVLPTRGYPDIVVTGPEVWRAFEEQGQRWLEEAAAVARAAAPDVRVEMSVVHEYPAAALIAASSDARSVVLGSRGLGGFVGMLVGSVSVALVAHGKCPVVVVRDEPPSRGPVVVGVDGSPVSEQAVGYAFDSASLCGAPLTAVLADGPGEDAERLLAQRLTGWQQKYPHVRVERAVVHDSPVSALLDAARDARLLVVGSHGRGGFTGMLLGSTSHALLHHAPCPLVVVRPHEDAAR